MSEYRLVFDITRQGYSFLGGALPPATAALILGALRIAIQMSKPQDQRSGARLLRGILAFGCLFFGVVTVAISRSLWSEYRDLSRAVSDGRYTLVTGSVTHLATTGTDGHSSERFQVGDAVFEYHAAVATPAFHQTAANGGPIRTGLGVRIASVDGAIARLEVVR